VTPVELLDGAKDSPLLLAVLVIGGFVVWAIERLSGANGPLTRALQAWQERELRRLRRERAVAEERRAGEQAREDARVAELESEVAWLREQLARRRRGEPEQPPDTEPLRRADRRNSARPPVPPR
jgi:hypothetical protein